MKRLTKEGWRALRVFNSHDICKRGEAGIFVGYYPAENGRAGRYACWRVHRPGFKTDPNGHWIDNYNKTFTVCGQTEKESRRLEAIKWAAERYNIQGEWERDPWGDWHPEGTLEAARRACESVPS